MARKKAGVVGLLTLALAMVSLTAPSAMAISGPTSGTPPTLGADDKPMWQTNGVVWALAAGNGVVYAGGSFTSVRPPGAAPGTAEEARTRLAAFDASSGELLGGWQHRVDGPVYALNLSPDGSTLYVGGNFTKVDGKPRSDLAAIDLLMPGGELTEFSPAMSGGLVRAVASTSVSVYAGGTFTAVGGTSQARLAALNPADGALQEWTPVLDGAVNALIVAPPGDRLAVGGAFYVVNGERHRALAGVSLVDGSNTPMDDGLIPYCTNGCRQTSVVKTLATDGRLVYVGAEGTGYGWFDGTLAVDPLTGHQVWKDNCLGATQGVAVLGGVLYVGSHAHDCSAIGGFPQAPFKKGWHHLMAENTTDGGLLSWWPTTNAGPTNGQEANELGPRALATDGVSIFVAGQFTVVNGRPQQGLTRFSPGPDTTGPTAPRVVGTSNKPGQVTLHWQGSTDDDDGTLTYNVYRDGSAAPIYTTGGVPAIWWQGQQWVFRDSGVAAGKHTYTVRAVDAGGNVASSTLTVTVVSTANGGYRGRIISDRPAFYWRLDEAPGSAVAADSTGNGTTGTYNGGVTLGVTGGVADNSAASLGTGYISANGTAVPPPTAVSVELWFRTTTNKGGQLIGFGDRRTGISTKTDRVLYMNNGGQLMFAVFPSSGMKYLWSEKAYNDGSWHHVVVTQDPTNGLAMHIDGSTVGRSRTATGSAAFSGFWRVGGDKVTSLPRRPSNQGMPDGVDEVAVYPGALTFSQALNHWRMGD